MYQKYYFHNEFEKKRETLKYKKKIKITKLCGSQQRWSLKMFGWLFHIKSEKYSGKKHGVNFILNMMMIIIVPISVFRRESFSHFQSSCWCVVCAFSKLKTVLLWLWWSHIKLLTILIHMYTFYVFHYSVLRERERDHTAYDVYLNGFYLHDIVFPYILVCAYTIIFHSHVRWEHI